MGGVVVNQVLRASERAPFLERRRRDQARALASLRADHGGGEKEPGGTSGSSFLPVLLLLCCFFRCRCSLDLELLVLLLRPRWRRDGLGDLQVIEAPIVDIEVRGVPALRYFAEKSWKRPLAEMEKEVKERVGEIGG